MTRFEWEKFRKTQIYITPDLPEMATKRYKFSLLRIIGYGLIYTFFSWMLLILILGVTPLKDFLFVLDEKEFKVQAEKVAELQEKVSILTSQLQEVASTNEKMKYAMQLAMHDSSKKREAVYDTLKKPINKKIKIGGNVLDAFKLFFQKYFPDSTANYNLFFRPPVNGFVTQQFNKEKGHFGIDYGMKIGSPVYSAAGGLIVFADYTIENGNTIIIEHDIGFISIYQHCSTLIKRTRDFVKQGEIIALSGNSGKNTTGPHLHFELWQNGKPVDPEKFLIK